MNARFALAVVAAGITGASSSAFADSLGTVDDSGERIVRAGQGFAREHAAEEPRPSSTLLESRTPRTSLRTKARSAVTSRNSKVAAAGFGDAWIYEASTDIFYDDDGDGYYHYLRVRFDVDSIYPLAYVYAEIYISADGETWEHLHSTDDFAVWGSDPNDDYEVETELVSGYTTALYDVLIELYDADTGTLLDEYGPAESSDFSLVPLEDAYRDAPIAPPPPPHHGGGGALGWALLPGLAAALGAARRPRNARYSAGSSRRITPGF